MEDGVITLSQLAWDDFKRYADFDYNTLHEYLLFEAFVGFG